MKWQKGCQNTGAAAMLWLYSHQLEGCQRVTGPPRGPCGSGVGPGRGQLPCGVSDWSDSFGVCSRGIHCSVCVIPWHLSRHAPMDMRQGLRGSHSATRLGDSWIVLNSGCKVQGSFMAGGGTMFKNKWKIRKISINHKLADPTETISLFFL